MAKSKSMVQMLAKSAGMTFVKSRVYGDHFRSRRGTHTRVEPNDALRQQSKNLINAIIPAKMFQDAIGPYRGSLAGGQMWQRLLSLFRKQFSDHGSFDFGKLGRFEIHKGYTFVRFLYPQPTIAPDKEKSLLDVVVRYSHHPKFTNSKNIDGYQLTVIGIFPDVEMKTARTVSGTSSIIGLEGELVPFQTQLAIPPDAENFVVCIKIEACIKGVVHDARPTSGMCIIGSGVV